MKGLYCCVFILFVIESIGFGQNVGDFQSRQTGNWSLTTTWERWDGASWIGPAPTVPTGTAGVTITILNAHVVTSNSGAYTLSGHLVVAVGGTLSIGNSIAGTTDFTIASGGMISNNGTLSIANGVSFPANLCQLNVSGAVGVPGTLENTGNITFGNPSSRLAFLANSLYDHLFTTAPGSIPGGANVSWNAASTCRISGYTTNNLPPSGLNQTFGNFVWNTQSLDLGAGMGGGLFDLNGALTGVQSDLTIESTGPYGDALFLTFSTPFSAIAINNFTVNGGFVALTGDANITFDVSQNVTVGENAFFAANLDASNSSVDINGNLSVNGSFDLSASTGTTNLNLAGNLDAPGAFQITGGAANFRFDGSVQAINNSLDFPVSVPVNFTIGNGNAVTVLSLNSNSIRSDGNFLVNEHSQLNIGQDGYVEGSGNFTLSQNTTLRVASVHASGAIQASGPPYNGNIRISGTRTYNSGDMSLPSTIEYNGSGPQFIGLGHPAASGVNTVINNAAGVTMAANVTIGGRLYLDNGNINVGSRTLTMNDEFQADSPYGLNVTSSSSLSIGVGDAGPFGILTTLGSNTINNLTFNRSGQTLNIGNNLIVNGTLTHDANIDFSGFSFEIKGPYTTTGGSLIGNASSSLIISGSGAITGAVSLNGTLGTLTINRPVGVTNTTSIIVTTALNILSGTYQGDGLVTLNSGATLTRGDGIITKSLSVSSYNLVYTSGGATVTGSELVTSPSTALNNLTISSGNSITILPSVTNVTVNGTLSLLSGQFISNGKGIILEGNVVSSGTGTFTGSLVTFSGNTTISGTVELTLDDVTLENGATLNLGSATVNFAGDIDSDNGGTWVAGTSTVNFAGATALTINETNTPNFNNVVITPSSTLSIDCSSCGTENNRPFITISGNWNSNNSGAVFTPAVSVPSEVTAVKFIGSTQTIATLPSHSFWDLNLGGTGTLTLSQALTVANDLEIEGTKSLSTGSNQAISLGGDLLFDGGTFTPNQGTVTFNGSSSQVIDRLSGSGSANFFNMVVNKTGGSFANAMNVNLQNLFTISSATNVDFDGPGGTDNFILISTASRTASIGPIVSPAVPANVTGSVTAQRFMHGEGQIYRYISSPVATTAAQLQDNFPITGSFTGNTTCASFVPGRRNMYSYNEQLTGTFDDGYVGFPATTNTESLVSGRGYSVQMCDGASAITWDVKGAINKGNISLPVTYNLTGAGGSHVQGTDGFNLVGNPYPSPVDWNAAGWTKTNISGTFYVRDNGTGAGGGSGGGVYTSWNGAMGTNGGTRYIAVGQAFWVEATGSSPVLTATESVKANQQPSFFREASPANYVRITLVNGLNRDEALIHFREDATSAFDPNADARKLFNDIFSFATYNSDSALMAINSVEPLTCSKEFGFDMIKTTPGNYSLEFSEFESFNEPVKIFLVDNYTNQTIAIGEKLFYDFTIDTNPLSSGNKRFKVIISRQSINSDVEMEGINAACNDNAASVVLNSSDNSVVYFATHNGEVVSNEFSGTGNKLTLDVSLTELSLGENDLIIYARTGTCQAVPLENNVTIVKDRLYSPVVADQKTVCQQGSASLHVSGAPDNGFYNWYESMDSVNPLVSEDNGEFETEELVKSKNYFVSIVNTLGCEGPRMEVPVNVVHYDSAIISVEKGQQLISNFQAGNVWYFNGSLIAGEKGQSLIIHENGEYQLEVTVPGGCTTTDKYLYLSEDGGENVSIFPNPASSHVEIKVFSANAVDGQIVGSSGNRIRALTFVNKNGIQSSEIDVKDLAPGFYIIKVIDGKNIVYKKLIKN